MNIIEKIKEIAETPDSKGNRHLTPQKIEAVAECMIEEFGLLNIAKICLQQLYHEEPSNKMLKNYYSYDGMDEDSLDEDAINEDFETVLLGMDENSNSSDELEKIRNAAAEEVSSWSEAEKENLKVELEQLGRKIERQEIAVASTDDMSVEAFWANYFGAIDGLYS